MGLNIRLKLFTSLGCLLSASLWLTISSVELECWPRYLAIACSVLLLPVCWFVIDIIWLNPSDSHTLKTLLIQYVFCRLMLFKGRSALREMQSCAKQVQKTQKGVLLSLLRTNEYTAYGNDRHFSRIKSVENYRKTHKLTEYKDYENYVGKIEMGGINILTRERVAFLALSTGTTGKNKLLPITDSMRRDAINKIRPMMTHVISEMGFFNLQRPFVLMYKTRAKRSAGGVPMGPVSQYIFHYVPFAVSPEPAFRVDNEQAALHIHAVFALQEREVGNIEALMSTLVYSFFKYLDSRWQAVCDDIEKGRLRSVVNLETTLLDELNSHLQPNVKRANELRKEFRKGSLGIAKRIWPNLRYSRMLTSGGFAQHAKALRDCHMIDVAQLSLLHVASESFMGINVSCQANSVSYTALPHCSFVEFIHSDDVSSSQPPTLLLHELKKNEQYEIVLTTPMGLYRYRTGDVIKVIDFYHQCPIYEFQYRIGQILNLYWEKTTEDILHRAIEQATKELQWRVVDYTATEDLHVTGIISDKKSSSVKHYVLFVEMEKRNTDAILTEKQLELFDISLRSIFELYNSMRANDSIGPMTVKQVREGAFLRLKQRMLADNDTQQFKMPRVVRHAIYLEFLAREIITT